MTTIPVNDNTPRNQYTASAAQTTFIYTFFIFTTSDLAVYVGDTLKTLTTDYTVTGANTENGGNVVFTSGLNNGDIVTISGDVDIKREVDLQQSGKFDPDDYNLEQDRNIVIMKQLARDIARCVQLDVTSTQDPVVFESQIVTVYDNLDDINTVADNIADVVAVGSDIASVHTAATNITAIQNAPAQAAAAAASAAAAAASAAAVNIPQVLTGKTLNMLRVKADESGYEFRTPSQVRTDISAATSGSSILKGNGSGGFSNAVSGTDYAPATSGSSILKGNGSGGFSNAVSGTDYAPATASEILIATGNAAASASISFTGLSSTYIAYRIVHEGISPGTDAVVYQAQFSIDNGSSYVATNYRWSQSFNTPADANSDSGSAGTGGFTTGIALMPTTATGFKLSNVAGETYAAQQLLFNPSSATSYKQLQNNSGHIGATANIVNLRGVGVWIGATTAVNAIKFFMDSGTFSGTLKIYGILA